ncbi:MAG: hypothetical protein WA208_15850 [Thermoanaerobaculia bacterium]
MTQRRPDPYCTHCHGTGVMTLNTPFLDRVEEETVTCRCIRDRQTSDPAEPSDAGHPDLTPRE